MKRIVCLDRYCNNLVDPTINPYCRKCRKKKYIKLGKADYKKRKAENKLQKESETDE